MPQEHLPLIAVPTTAGTGSEVTCVSVLTDHANGKKSPIVSDGFFPSYAIIDPELTYTMPPKVTAGTGEQKGWFNLGGTSFTNATVELYKIKREKP